MGYTIIKTANGYDSSRYREFMVKDETDLSEIDLRQTAPGSVAYNEDLSIIWILNADGVWVEAS